MIQLFNPENRFWNFVGKLADAACMSFLWLLASLPVVTIGAATAAFYAFTLDQVRELEGGVWKSFWKGFKERFKKATLLWLMELAGGAFLALELLGSWNLYVNRGLVGLVFLCLGFSVALIFLCCSAYLLPLAARFDFSLKKILTNSFVMAMGNLPVSAVLLLMGAGVLVLFYYLSGLFFFWAGLYIFLSSYLIDGVFRRYTGQARENAVHPLRALRDRLRKR